MPRILLVEDNPGDQNLIETLLRQSSPTLEIELCEDGEQALLRLSTDASGREIDLVLIDWNVPRRSGREVLSALAQSPQSRRRPVVVLSSSEAPNDVADAYDLGASGYLVKPIGYQEFSQRLGTFVQYWLSAVLLPPSVSAVPRRG